MPPLGSQNNGSVPPQVPPTPPATPPPSPTSVPTQDAPAMAEPVITAPSPLPKESLQAAAEEALGIKPAQAAPTPKPEEPHVTMSDPAASPTPSEPPVPSPLKQIRTFQGDVAEVIQKQNESLISIQRAEQKKREAVQNLGGATTSDEEGGGGAKALVLAILTIFLIAGGGYGAYWAWNTYGERIAPPIISTPENQFIGSAILTNIDASVLGRSALLTAVREARARTREATELEHLELRRGSTPDSELLTTEEFLTRLDTMAPNPLVRSFNDLFMLGVLGSDPSHTVLLIKLDSFVNAFPGMLEWEPELAKDLLPLFASESDVQIIGSSVEFRDKTIQNHDVRVLADSSDKTVLLYGFFDNSILILTDEEETFRTIVNRLQREKLSR